MQRAGAWGRMWGHPVPQAGGHKLCPWGRDPLPGPIWTRDMGSGARRRQFCRVLPFLFFVTDLATSLSAKPGGEPRLALGLRLI